jgi:pimeloyl-ACP methyl ester carboxylesterase
MIRETTVAGRRLRYAEVGAGRPALLLHAFPLSHALWKGQLDSPVPGWRFVAPDLRGFGESDRVAADAPLRAHGARSMADYASDVMALVDLLELERPVVAGVSMGGYVAFALLPRLGTRMAGLVLSDTRAEADTDEARGNRRRMQDLVMEKGPSAVADQMIPKLLGETSQRERPDLAGFLREVIEANGADAIHDALEALATRPDVSPMLAAVKCPTLVTVGREDVLTPVALHESMRAGIPGARLEVIERAGHLANLENPGAYNEVLREFLDGVAERG